MSIDIFSRAVMQYPALADLLARTCAIAKVSVVDVVGEKRDPRLVSARTAFVRLCRTAPISCLGHMRPSFPEIGRVLGCKNHTSAFTRNKRFDARPEAKEIYDAVMAIIAPVRPHVDLIKGEFTSRTDAQAFLFRAAGYELADLSSQHYTDLDKDLRLVDELARQATRKSTRKGAEARVRRAHAFLIQEGSPCASRTSSLSTSKTAS